MKRYLKQKASSERSTYNERADCTVLATAIACRMPYKDAHAFVKGLGRRNRKGFFTRKIVEQLHTIGLTATPVKKLVQKSGSRYTPKTIGSKLKSGYYMVICNQHVFAVVNGTVEDWTNGRQHRILQAWKITKTRKST